MPEVTLGAKIQKVLNYNIHSLASFADIILGMSFKSTSVYDQFLHQDTCT